MPKAKPLSVHPLTFHEALQAIISVDPDRVGLTPERRKPNSKTKSSPKFNRTAK